MSQKNKVAGVITSGGTGTSVKRKRGRPPKVLTEELTDGKPSVRKRHKRGQAEEGELIVTPRGSAWDALENPEKYVLPPQGRGYAAKHAEVLRRETPREQMNVRVRAELKRAMQILAAAQNLSLGDVVEEAIIDYIKKNSNRILED